MWRLIREWAGLEHSEPATPRKELIPGETFGQVVRSAVGAQFGVHGFQLSKKNQWSRENAPGIFAVVRLEPLKGAFTATWGVSLTFVPHVDRAASGFKIGSHRTEKAARLDLSYSPLDYERDLSAWCADQLSDPATFAQEVEGFATRIAGAASNFLDQLRSPEAILIGIEEKRSRPSIRLSFEHYPQEVLAYAFLLARAGRRQDAESAMRLFGVSIRQFDDCKDFPDSLLTELLGMAFRTTE